MGKPSTHPLAKYEVRCFLSSCPITNLPLLLTLLMTGCDRCCRLKLCSSSTVAFVAES